MQQDALSMEESKPSRGLSLKWRSRGLRWKIGMAFGGLILLLGIAVIGIVYSYTTNALTRQVELRASAIATNLSDASAGLIASKSRLEVDALVAKYGRLDGVAYAYIEDAKGEILATSVQPFPNELKQTDIVNKRVIASRTTQVQGKSVHETRVPVLEGQLGAVHVGLWADIIHASVRETVMTIIGLIALCLITGVLVSAIVANHTIKPLIELKKVADDISRGRLDTPVSIQSTDEVGELGRSLERMRASLRAAMARLNRD